MCSFHQRQRYKVGQITFCKAAFFAHLLLATICPDGDLLTFVRQGSTCARAILMDCLFVYFPCSAISVLVISRKSLLEIICIMISKFFSKMLINCRLGIFPVRTTINFLGSDFNKKDSKKSMSLLITILSSSFASLAICPSLVLFLSGKSRVCMELRPFWFKKSESDLGS